MRSICGASRIAAMILNSPPQFGQRPLLEPHQPAQQHRVAVTDRADAGGHGPVDLRQAVDPSYACFVIT